MSKKDKDDLDAILEEFGCEPITEADFDGLIELAYHDLALNEAPNDNVRVAPMLEAAAPRVIVPKKGKVIAEDGTVELAIMRPCISRGRRLRGLPPLYEASMLARHAGVFRNWPMFQDHLPPEVQEAMAKRGRSVKELGGRITEAWFDPDFAAEYDGDFGYERGAVRGRAIPQEPIASMIEKDPDVLHCSINAWPTAARPTKKSGLKVMEVQGIRSKPIGSVDWVIRGGAGGRVLSEDEHRDAVARVVTFLAESYTSPRHMAQGDDKTTPDFSKMTPAQLREHLQEHAPQLVGSLREEDGDGGEPSGRSTASIPASLSEERVQEIVAEAITDGIGSLRESFEGTADRLEERAQEIVTEREGQRQLAGRAQQVIEAAVGITPKMRADLKARYAVLPSGATQAIQLCESEASEDKDSTAVLEERLTADIEHMQEIVREAQGRPPVRRQGGSNGETRSGAASAREVPYWRRMAVAEGVLEDAKDESVVKMYGGGDE